jgi:hypothetical protein
MLPGQNSVFARYGIVAVNVLVNAALASLAIFTIYYWGRATYRMIVKRDWLTGIKEDQIIKAA